MQVVSPQTEHACPARLPPPLQGGKGGKPAIKTTSSSRSKPLKAKRVGAGAGSIAEELLSRLGETIQVCLLPARPEVSGSIVLFFVAGPHPNSGAGVPFRVAGRHGPPASCVTALVRAVSVCWPPVPL